MYRREYLKVLEWVLRVSGNWSANVYRSATVCATMANPRIQTNESEKTRET